MRHINSACVVENVRASLSVREGLRESKVSTLAAFYSIVA